MSEKQLHTLSLLEKVTSVQQQKLLKNCDTDFLIFCCECALNAVNGTVGINLKELRPYEKQLRLLCRKSTIKKRKKNNVTKTSDINEFDISFFFLLFDLLIFVMDTEEFILIPKSFYKQNNST